MAEAAAVIGLVASIVTIVELSAKIISRIADFTTQTSEVPKSFRTLTDRLPLLVQTLKRIQVRAQDDHVEEHVAEDLKTLMDGINVQIQFLEECLRKITPATDASRLSKGLKALKSLTNDERVRQAAKTIHDGIDVLVLHQTTTNIELSENILQQTNSQSDRILRELADLKLNKSPTQQTFGLCLKQAPQIDPDAFIGRTGEIQQLTDWLLGDDSTQPQKVVSIVGMGGLGKTQLSLAFARQKGHQFTSVFWLNAKDKLSLQQSLLTVSKIVLTDHENGTRDGDDEELQIQKVYRWLSEKWNDRWLLIFDNYDDPALPNVPSSTGFDIRSFFPERQQGSILITTRSRKLAFSKLLSLQKLDDEVGVAVLSQRAGRDTNNDTGAQQLATQLNGLPLALAAAGTYIAQTGISCAEYLDMYRESWNDLNGPESESLLEYADRTLSSTWTISLDHVGQQDEDAAELLKFFALLGNDDIWYELVRAGALDGPPWLDRVTATKIRFGRAMTKLCDYSLVEVVHRSYRIHPCVHDWLLEHYQMASNEEYFLAALHCVKRSLLYHTDPEYWTSNRRLVRHVQRLNQERFQDLWRACSPEEKVLEAGHRFAELFRELGQLREAEELFLRVLAEKEKALGPEHSSTLKTVNNLGVLYVGQRKLLEAEQLYQRVLAYREKTLGAEHPSTLDTVDNLGTLCHAQGRLAEAEQRYLRALSGLEKALGPEHSETLTTVSNLGVVYVAQRKLPEAEQLYQRVLSGREKAFGPEHLSTLDTVDNLGNLYHTQGRLGEAEQQYLRALAGLEKMLGSEHPSTLNTLNNLGTLNHEQGKLAEAEQQLTRALAGRAEALGPEHPLTLDTVDNLGTLYYTQGRLEEAKQQYLRALDGLEKLLGSEHPSTLNTLNNLGLLNYEQGKLAEAEQQLTRALAGREEVLGPEHPSTLDTVDNLGTLYVAQGRLVEADHQYTRALSGLENILGKDHSSTQGIARRLDSLHNSQSWLDMQQQMSRATITGSDDKAESVTDTLGPINDNGLQATHSISSRTDTDTDAVSQKIKIVGVKGE